MEQSNNEAMTYLLFLFLEIIFLFYLSRTISQTLSFLPIHVLSLLFFPGVVVHELSHLLVASIMFVRVDVIEFRPKVTKKKLKLGSVGIAKTDPVRRAIIGFSPVGVGVLLILGIVYFFWSNLGFFRESPLYISIPMTLCIIYILFVISNTMFSSGKDMEGTLELLMVFLVIFGAFYFAGFRLPPFFIDTLFSKEVLDLIQKSSIFLLVPIVIDLVLLGIIKLLYKRR